MIEAMGRGEKVEAPYRLSDLVSDTIGFSTHSASRERAWWASRWAA